MNDIVTVNLYDLVQWMMEDKTLKKLEKLLNEAQEKNVKNNNFDMNLDEAFIKIRCICLLIALTIPDTKIEILVAYLEEHQPEIFNEDKNKNLYQECYQFAVNTKYLTINDNNSGLKNIINQNLQRVRYIQSILQAVCHFKNFEMIKYLVARGTNLSHFYFAFEEILSDLDILRFFLEQGMEIGLPQITEAMKKLIEAKSEDVISRHLKILEVLLSLHPSLTKYKISDVCRGLNLISRPINIIERLAPYIGSTESLIYDLSSEGYLLFNNKIYALNNPRKVFWRLFFLSRNLESSRHLEALHEQLFDFTISDFLDFLTYIIYLIVWTVFFVFSINTAFSFLLLSSLYTMLGKGVLNWIFSYHNFLHEDLLLTLVAYAMSLLVFGVFFSTIALMKLPPTFGMVLFILPPHVSYAIAAIFIAVLAYLSLKYIVEHMVGFVQAAFEDHSNHRISRVPSLA